MRILSVFPLILGLIACSPEPDTQNAVSVAPLTEVTESSDSADATEPASLPAPSAAETDAEPVLTLEWDSLIPPDFLPERLMEQYNVDELEDDDPRAAELMEKLEKMWREAPAVEALDGSRVKLPGFVVPLEGDGEGVTDFLLVPYFGACIHVPPPPANQIVYVEARGGEAKARQAFDTVWVTGRMRIERTASEMGEAGYRLEASRVEPYEE